MKQIVLNFACALGLLFSVQTQARPIINEICQTKASPYSQVTLCSRHEVSSGQSFGYTVNYKGGLLKLSRTVFVGGTSLQNGFSFSIWNGTSDWSSKALSVQPDGSGSINLPGGGRNAVISLYFVTPDGKYDSVYGRNYNFVF